MRLPGALAVLALGLISAGFPALARAAPVRILLSVGSNIGDPEDAPLRFADSDAQRLLSLFVEIGQVAPDRAYLLLDEPAQKVREKLAEAAGRIAELAAAGNEVSLILYVSSHARAGELHLRGTHLPLAELRDFAAATKARVRVLIVDACDSGAIARRKGGAPGPDYEVAIDRLPLGGQVTISSSGPAESAQEWDSLGGSLFTHYLLTGLRGDADLDGDGKVSVSEAYGYAYRRTVLDSAGGAQHPAFDMDLAGTGELVLSEPASAKSALVFPANLEGRYVVASQPRPNVVAEVDKRAGRPLRLAVPPGRYLVRKALGHSVGLLTVELPFGGEKTVDESALVKRNFAEIALKGGSVELHPSAALGLFSLASAPLDGAGTRWRIGAGYRRTWGESWGLASLGFGRARFEGVQLATTESDLALGIAGGYRLLYPAVSPLLGLGAEALWMRQSFVRAQEADIQRVFGQGPLPTRSAVGFGAGPMVGVELSLPMGAFVLATIQAQVRYLPAADQSAWSLGAHGSIGAGATF